MAHWAFRRLASMLSRDGFHVLRFDWSGTGDSWGETTDGTFETWLADIGLAAQELRDASAARSVAIVGMRLGAALAALACAQGLEAERLVLWEPVVTGRRYIAELEALHDREQLRLLHSAAGRGDDLVGFAFPAALRGSIEGIDLGTTPPRNVENVAIVSSTERSDHRALRETLERAGCKARYECVPEDPSATNAGAREAALLTTRSLSTIADYLAGRLAS